MADSAKIAQYLAAHETETPSILTGSNITSHEIEMADIDIASDENILLMVKTWGKIGETASAMVQKLSFKGIGKHLGKVLDKTRMGTMILTDKKLYWARLRPDTVAAGITGIVGNISGSVELSELRQAVIGEHDHCFGNGYMGHQLVVNGNNLGLLRMGFGIEYDEKAIAFLNALFDECVNM